MKGEEEKDIKCDECPYKTNINRHLQRHIQSVHEGRIFPCTLCQYKATWKDSLQRHVNSIHKGQIFPCSTPPRIY